MGDTGGYSDGWDDSDSGGQPCAVGRHCGEADYQGHPQIGPRAFCRTDELRIGDVIRKLPETYVEVHLKLAKGQKQDGERVTGGGKEAPTPLDLDVEAFCRRIVLTALTWEERVREAADLSNPNLCPDCQQHGGRRADRECPVCDVLRVRDGAALSRACRLLAGPDRERTGHLTALLALAPDDMWQPVKPDEIEDGMPVRVDSAGDAWQRTPMGGTDAGLEFLALNGRARGILGLTLRSRPVLVPCNGCDSYTLKQREAIGGGWEEVVRCTGCPEVYIGDAFNLLMERWWDAAQQAGRAS